MFVRQVYDDVLAHASYIIGCQATGEAILIDPSRDIDQYTALAEANNLRIVAAADTHIHADYISGLQACAEAGMHVYASGEGGSDWQYQWLLNSHLPHTILRHGDVFTTGNLTFKTVHTPGHTPEHVSFALFDRGIDEPIALLSGDFLFVGDVGRPDLLETAAGIKGAREPSARALYQSIEQLRALAPYVQVWPAHGAGSACGKSLGAIPTTTVGYELRHNAAIAHATSEHEFVSFILSGQPATPRYFARMKRDNRGGIASWQMRAVPRVHGAVQGSVLLDIRSEREQRARPLSAAIVAPLDAAWPSIAGSFIAEGAAITLVAHPADVERCTRLLARIGYDRVLGYLDAHDVPAHTPRAVTQFANLPPGAFVLDVRTTDEHTAGHIPGAQNIPHTLVVSERARLPTNQTIYVHCALGGRARAATAALCAHGFDAVLIDEPFTAYTGKRETGA